MPLTPIAGVACDGARSVAERHPVTDRVDHRVGDDRLTTVLSTPGRPSRFAGPALVSVLRVHQDEPGKVRQAKERPNGDG